MVHKLQIASIQLKIMGILTVRMRIIVISITIAKITIMILMVIIITFHSPKMAINKIMKRVNLNMKIKKVQKIMRKKKLN